jgi:hypothetical protein
LLFFTLFTNLNLSRLYEHIVGFANDKTWYDTAIMDNRKSDWHHHTGGTFDKILTNPRGTDFRRYHLPKILKADRLRGSDNRTAAPCDRQPIYEESHRKKIATCSKEPNDASIVTNGNDTMVQTANVVAQRKLTR